MHRGQVTQMHSELIYNARLLSRFVRIEGKVSTEFRSVDHMSQGMEFDGLWIVGRGRRDIARITLLAEFFFDRLPTGSFR